MSFDQPVDSFKPPPPLMSKGSYTSTSCTTLYRKEATLHKAAAGSAKISNFFTHAPKDQNLTAKPTKVPKIEDEDSLSDSDEDWDDIPNFPASSPHVIAPDPDPHWAIVRCYHTKQCLTWAGPTATLIPWSHCWQWVWTSHHCYWHHCCWVSQRSKTAQVICCTLQAPCCMQLSWAAWAIPIGAKYQELCDASKCHHCQVCWEGSLLCLSYPPSHSLHTKVLHPSSSSSRKAPITPLIIE